MASYWTCVPDHIYGIVGLLERSLYDPVIQTVEALVISFGLTVGLIIK